MSLNYLRLRRLLAVLSMMALSAAVAVTITTADGQETDEEERVAKISVRRIALCTAIEEREPVGTAEVFPPGVSKVFCFTELASIGPETTVVHRWFYKDKEMAAISLKAEGDRWRTWSSKNIDPSAVGKWRVEIVSAEGEVLATAEFEIRDTSSDS